MKDKRINKIAYLVRTCMFDRKEEQSLILLLLKELDEEKAGQDRLNCAVADWINQGDVDTLGVTCNGCGVPLSIVKDFAERMDSHNTARIINDYLSYEVNEEEEI